MGTGGWSGPRSGGAFSCHPEPSEGSCSAHKIPRCARDDMKRHRLVGPSPWHTFCRRCAHPIRSQLMRHWWIPALVMLAACNDDDDGPSGPGITPEAPATLSSTSLDGAIALVWSDNPFQNDPDIFASYRIYSASFSIDTGE